MIDEFAEFMANSKNIVVLTGAGISTLSGIPDFRGNGGVYTRKFNGLSAEEILSIDFFYANPQIFYSWCKDVWYNLDKYKPNIVHYCLAKMEEKNKIRGIYTQNIDMLHQRAGSKKVYELHGSAQHNRCTKCGTDYSYEQIALTVNNDKVPYCNQCGGLIKPDIVLYGEGLNSDLLDKAFEDFTLADVCLVLGTSLVVSPASGLPQLTLSQGKPLAIINKSDTFLDSRAKYCIRDLQSAFEKLSRIL